jgi:hypothetical protein
VRFLRPRATATIAVLFLPLSLLMGPSVAAELTSLDAPSQPATTIDLRSQPLPAEEPGLARSVLTCELEEAELCRSVVSQLIELPFAWHRAGYTVRIRDGDHAPRNGTDRRTTGLADAAAREISLFIHWTDTVVDVEGAFLGVKRTLAHELGHVMHQTCGEEVLTGWRQARSLPAAVPTRGHGPAGQFDSVAEDFAEAAMATLTDGEFRVRSPLGVTGSEPAHPGQWRATLPPSELAAAFFVVCG